MLVGLVKPLKLLRIILPITWGSLSAGSGDNLECTSPKLCVAITWVLGSSPLSFLPTPTFLQTLEGNIKDWSRSKILVLRQDFELRCLYKSIPLLVRWANMLNFTSHNLELPFCHLLCAHAFEKLICREPRRVIKKWKPWKFLKTEYQPKSEISESTFVAAVAFIDFFPNILLSMISSACYRLFNVFAYPSLNSLALFLNSLFARKLFFTGNILSMEKCRTF